MGRVEVFKLGCERLDQSPVAQLVERLPVKEDVVGSRPTGGAKFALNIPKRASLSTCSPEIMGYMPKG